MRPWLAAASAVMNIGCFEERSNSSRLPNPMPSPPHALPVAISTRMIPDRSSRFRATGCPPVSSTTTVRGARFKSRPFLSAASMMVLA
jgi:hypothetical protein